MDDYRKTGSTEECRHTIAAYRLVGDMAARVEYNVRNTGLEQTVVATIKDYTLVTRNGKNAKCTWPYMEDPQGCLGQ